ncbi:UDP-N-acetylglucosamine 1-carboxyvinyltransferase [Bacilli bacterium PM5-3]|nr:UDP-N-acetylglucosamine 1-carboxyvinyltransferase [Bacilli bacterium PM5-3]MDH6603917.1 UDP-N-acetylglucosamine 1-carboxyvinyltransferase [Bacilli bacterium PM5-9]
MEEIIKIEGKHKLNGTVKINGAKNATVALIPALVLADEPVVLQGVPNISDVAVLAEILRFLGVEVTISGDEFKIDPTNMENKELPHNLSSKLRASYYFMGSLLGKYNEVKMKMPGGCYLGPRPINLHIKGFELLGAQIKDDYDGYHLSSTQLVGSKVYLDFASVGATINIILAATKADGVTVIENAAKEPEIIDVCNLLNKMGAKIKGAGTDEITITGVDYLHSCIHEIIPDRIEAGTYLIIAAAAGEKVEIENVIPQHLDSLTSKLIEMGVNLEILEDSIIVSESNELKGVDISTQVYPGFATDLQQPLTALLTQAQGVSKIADTIYPERFKHTYELNKMGANISTASNMAIVEAPTALRGSQVTATDLRCGAAMIVAGLIATGTTEIDHIYHIDRGYANIDETLASLGAKIWREQRED